MHDEPKVESIRPYCPYFGAAMDGLSRRWATIVLRAVLGGAHRFSDIANAVPEMTDKLLSQRLKDLEAEGLIVRFVEPTTPVRIEYQLSEKGEELGKILLDLNEWALEWTQLPADRPDAD